MKKNAKRLLGLLIALAMMVSLVGTMALADSSTGNDDLEVTYIGTSVSSGFFLNQYQYKGLWSDKDWAKIKEECINEFGGGPNDEDVFMAYRPYDALVPGSAPRLVAHNLGMTIDDNRCANFHKLCFTGLRTSELLRFMYGEGSAWDKKMSKDWLSQAYMTEGHYSGFGDGNVKYLYEHTQQWIKDSDIIIVEIGANDIMTTAIDSLFDERGTFLKTVKNLNTRALHDKLVDIVKKGGDLSSVVITALDAAQKAGELPLMMTAMTKALLEGTMMFYTNYGKVIKEIYKLNSDAMVVALGTFNPLNGVKISNKLPLEASMLMDPNIRMMNAYIKTLAPYALSSRYDYRYVDNYDVTLHGINNTLIGMLTSDKFDEFDATKTGPIHPNDVGHKQMADKILAAINK